MAPKTIFILVVAVFVLKHVLEHLGISHPLSTSYLDDLLLFPIILYLVLQIHRRWRLKSDDYRMPVSHVVGAVVFYSLLFELVLPHFSRRFTGDVLDIVFYSAGAGLFIFLMNR
ncbi:MAG: hypothetical protein ACE5GL_05680 [Calditrichia bacterium]